MNQYVSFYPNKNSFSSFYSLIDNYRMFIKTQNEYQTEFLLQLMLVFDLKKWIGSLLKWRQAICAYPLWGWFLFRHFYSASVGIKWNGKTNSSGRVWVSHGNVINEQFGGRPDSCPVFFSNPAMDGVAVPRTAERETWKPCVEAV